MGGMPYGAALLEVVKGLHRDLVFLFGIGAGILIVAVLAITTSLAVVLVVAGFFVVALAVGAHQRAQQNRQHGIRARVHHSTIEGSDVGVGDGGTSVDASVRHSEVTNSRIGVSGVSKESTSRIGTVGGGGAPKGRPESAPSSSTTKSRRRTARAADPAKLQKLLSKAARAGVVPAIEPAEEPEPEAIAYSKVAIDTKAPRFDDVQCTVFAPQAVSPGSTILVQVFAHLLDAAGIARAIATELDVGARRRAFRSLEAPVADGERLDFELRLPGLEIDDPVASLKWQGRTEAVQFGVHVPPATTAGTVIGTVSVSRAGIPLGHVKFAFAIDDAAADWPAAEPQGVEARPYRFAFVSYASEDRDEVLRRVQMLRVAKLPYFQDVLDLDAGEVWSAKLEAAIRQADVLLLFWSSRAKESEWVRKEVDFALACKAGDELSPPEIRPVIIEGPPVVRPWDDLAHLHFNDRVLYFMSRPR